MDVPGTAAKPRKPDRLHMRLAGQAASLIRQAAAVRGQTVTDFVTEAAREKAENVLIDQQHFLASPEAWDQFVAALEKPVQANPRLLARLRALTSDPDSHR